MQLFLLNLISCLNVPMGIEHSLSLGIRVFLYIIMG